MDEPYHMSELSLLFLLGKVFLHTAKCGQTRTLFPPLQKEQIREAPSLSELQCKFWKAQEKHEQIPKKSTGKERESLPKK